MDDSIKNVLAMWREKLATARDMFDGPVQLPLHVADVRSVLGTYCPDNFAAMRDDLAQRTPTHVLLFADELDQLLYFIDRADKPVPAPAGIGPVMLVSESKEG